MVYILVVCKVLCTRKVEWDQLLGNVYQIVYQKLVNAILIEIMGLSHFFLGVYHVYQLFYRVP